MISLEVALLSFLFLACFLFSIIYASIDNHSQTEIYLDFFQNLKLFFLGLLLCAVLVNGLQAIFGT